MTLLEISLLSGFALFFFLCGYRLGCELETKRQIAELERRQKRDEIYFDLLQRQKHERYCA